LGKVILISDFGFSISNLKNGHPKWVSYLAFLYHQNNLTSRMGKIKLFVVFIFSAATISSYAQIPVKPPHFPLMDKGWIGGDGAFSITLNDTARLWLFGDSWIGQIKDNKRFDAVITRNTVAIEGKDKNIHYYLRDSKAPFFTNTRKGEWYWPADGICINNTLYVFLSRVTMRDSADNTGFGFANTGEDVAIIHLNSNNPLEWKIDYQQVPINTLHLAAAVARNDKYVYLFGDDQSVKHTTYLARLPVNDVTDFAKLEYYYPKLNQWKAVYNDAVFLFDAAPEFSVRYDAASKNWIAIYSKGGMSRYIMMRYAKKITGPWSNGRVIAECPEMQWNKNYYGYEAKQTAPLKGGKTDTLAITYLINSFSFWDVAKDTRIYVPQIIRLKNPLLNRK
jgi:hypothetical protein